MCACQHHCSGRPRLLTWLLALCVISAPLRLGGQEMTKGRAIITTIDGDVRLIHADGDQRPARLHEILELSELQVVTGKRSYFGLSLSNGLGLCVGPESTLAITDFLQRPFLPSEASVDFEPSVSRLSLNLQSGRIAFAADRLSPLSEIVITIPQGLAETRATLGAVGIRDGRVRLTALQGSLLFIYPESKGQEFIGQKQGIEVSDFAATRGRPDLRFEEADFDAETVNFIKAAYQASRRVMFTVEGLQAAIPVPRLVVSEEALQLPSPRPYDFLR